MKDIQNPDILLIGGHDEKSTDILVRFYSEYVHNLPRIHAMSLENAELTKVAINTFLTAKISFANSLAIACSRIPGGNVDIVTSAVGDDTRIGNKFLRGGLGYGGPCLPRDNRALSFIFYELGVPHDLSDATDEVNLGIPGAVMGLVQKKLGSDVSGKSALVCGITYKPGSSVVEESQGALIAHRLRNHGMEVSVIDPDVDADDLSAVGGDFSFHAFFDAHFMDYELVIIATNDDCWKDFRREWFNPDTIIIDCWRILDDEFHAVPGYTPFGISLVKPDDSHLEDLWTNR